MIYIRRAKLSDKPRIVEISSKVWDGDDYLPFVFEKWVEEKGGEFSVITVDDVVAGCSKMTLLPENVLWLEGIRVDADYRGRGLGKKLAQYQLKRAKELTYSRLELSTFIENHESISIIERNGFKRVASFKFLFMDLAKALESPQELSQDILSADKTDQVKKVRSIKEVGELFQKLNTENRQSYVNLDWTFVKCDEKFLDELIQRGFVYKTEDTIFAFGDWGQKDDGMTLYFMFGKNKDLVVKYMISQAVKSQASNIVIMSTGGNEEETLLKQHNFITFTEEEYDAFVYRYQEPEC